MTGEYYKMKYQQQLQLGRRIWLEEYQKPRKGDISDIEQTIQALMMSLEEREREVQEKEKEVQEKENEKVREVKLFHWQMEQKEREEAEKDQEIQRYRHELQEKDREEAEREERYHNQLQEKDRELQEKDREHHVVLQELQEKNRKLQEKDMELQVKNNQLQVKDANLQVKDMELQVKDRELQEKERELQEKERELQEKDRELKEKDEELCAVRTFRYQQQAELTDDHWSINKDEVTLTNEELGRGSYAVVTVGIFRGLRVAVKSLHAIIISDYNLGIFSREMSIASRVRHPNLVQFIGATKVDSPLILTELMSTSLNHELQRNRLTNQQILSIAQDVALGLNYLHLFKPQPIIHRDVSSPNVLLKPCTGPAGYEAKVADYGTAKVVQVNSTSTGTVMPGNVAYASPESRDPDQHSPAMDVYSYSVLLMEMNLCSPPEMMTAEREVQSGSVSWSDMKSLIQRGLNANPRDRPTMAQVIESLGKIKI